MAAEDEWGPCESREEWLLMYERGLSPERIAELCRTKLRNVQYITSSRDRRDRAFFDRRLVLHDQPSLPRQRPRLTWQQSYDNLAWFVDTMGRLPSQLGSTWERQCHGFLYLQRKLHRTGSLTAEQVQLLDRIEGWFVPGRAPDHWQQRFDAYLRFMEEKGHQPRSDAPNGTAERVLRIWLWSQRRRVRNGTMPNERIQLLDANIPQWRGRSLPRQR
jgi:hypothetical protein